MNIFTIAVTSMFRIFKEQKEKFERKNYYELKPYKTGFIDSFVSFNQDLAKELGIPVVQTSARQGEGMNELLNMIHEVASGKYICKPYRIKSNSSELNSAIEKLSREIELEFPGLPNLRWVALRLLEGDQSIIDAIRNGDLGNLKKDVAMSEVEG